MVQVHPRPALFLDAPPRFAGEFHRGEGKFLLHPPGVHCKAGELPSGHLPAGRFDDRFRRLRNRFRQGKIGQADHLAQACADRRPIRRVRQMHHKTPVSPLDPPVPQSVQGQAQILDQAFLEKPAVFSF